MKKLDFYYDVVCPYAYLASTRVESLAARNRVELNWKPMLLGGVFRAIGAGDGPMPSMPTAKAALNLADMQRWAAHLGVPLTLHPRHPVRSVQAMRLLHTVEGAERVKLSHALYRAYFVEHRQIDERAVLKQILVENQLDPQLEAKLDDDSIKDALRRTTDEAVRDGVFGAPGFVVDEDGRRTLYYGQDRMHLVERALGGIITPTAWGPAVGDRRVDFFYDFSSPYAYLGSTQIERVARQAGAQVVWKPFLLGALFKEIGTPVVPIAAASEPKRRYLARDADDWAKYWNVPFRWPSRFPMRTVLPLRVALAVDETLRPAVSRAIFAAYWADDRDIADAQVLAEVLRPLGVADAVARAEEPAVKSALKALTDEAVARGLCGAPSFVVRDHLFWGQDRLDFVARTLAGWDPP